MTAAAVSTHAAAGVSTDEDLAGLETQLQRARVLLELGLVAEAEGCAIALRRAHPESLDALSLFAKVKHLRGELSQAIACWAELRARSQVHAATPLPGLTGHEATMPPHETLEPALEMLRQRRPLEARAWCLDVAARTKGENPHEYKQAMIGASWIAELCGDLVAAREGLEELGAEGAFANDEDRLHSLVRVYHELGTPDAVEAAVRVCRHLIDELARRGAEKLSLIGMLASLERRAGRDELAGELEGQVLGAMRRRMHRATLEDVVRVAAREYLPLGRLREVHLPTGALPPPEELPRRERAIAFAVRGEPTALALFAQSDDPLDRRYLADLAPPPVRRASRPRTEPAIGRVLAAAVYHLGTRPKGFLHEVAAYRMRTTAGAGGVLPPDEIHGNLTPELRAAVRSAFISVRDYARAKFPAQTGDLDDYVYVYKLPKEDEQSGGLSAGLPTALAFLSVFLQRPVPRDVASSGALVCEAHDVIAIGPIGEAEHKVRAAYHGNLRSLLLPLANRDELERSTLVPRAITHEVVRFVADLDHAVRLVFARS